MQTDQVFMRDAALRSIVQSHLAARRIVQVVENAQPGRGQPLASSGAEREQAREHEQAAKRQFRAARLSTRHQRRMGTGCSAVFAAISAATPIPFPNGTGAESMLRLRSCRTFATN